MIKFVVVVVVGGKWFEGDQIIFASMRQPTVRFFCLRRAGLLRSRVSHVSGVVGLVVVVVDVGFVRVGPQVAVSCGRVTSPVVVVCLVVMGGSI